jgi:hypothetical protein
MPPFGYGIVSIVVVLIIMTLILWWKKNPLVSNYDKTGKSIQSIIQHDESIASLEVQHLDSKWWAEKIDMHPKSWMSKYSKTSFGYMLKMGFFYSVVGLGAAYSVYGIQLFVFGYEEPVFPFSLILAVTAGPIEETIFFGIPYVISGNSYVVLGTGAIWSSLHLLNTNELAFDGFLANSNFAFTIPHIFFSLRAWKSGKGWFTIFFHSAWNALMFGIAVSTEEIPFEIFSTDDLYVTELDDWLIVLSAILMAITYPLYRWRLKRELRKEQKSQIQHSV